MALLQALRNTHPLTPADVHIYNGGVVATTNKRHHRDVRARMRQGGRALWNRIEGATTHTQGSTGYTAMWTRRVEEHGKIHAS